VGEKLIVKEFLQKEANARTISTEIIKLLENKPYTTQMKQGLLEVKARLGKGGGSKNIAELALKLLKQ
jgi:lipid-A-disaccharide synthase